MSYLGRGLDNISNVEKLDNITFNGGTTYALTKSSAAFTPAGSNNILISIDGVVQQGNFSISGSNIVFTFSPTSSNTCDFIMHYGTGLITTPADSTVTDAKIVDMAASKLTGTVSQSQIADQAINEAKLQISNAPTNGYMLTAQSGNTGGLTWAEAGSGAMELLSSATRTSGSVGQVYMTDFMDSTKYISYIAHCSFKNAGNGNNQFFNFTSSGGTTMEATNYYGAGNAVKNANGSLSNNTREIATNENKVSWVATASTRVAFMEFVMHPIGVTTDSGVSTVFFRGQIDRWTGSSREPQYVTGAAYYINSTVPTGFVIGAQGGNWERYEIRVYGLKKA
tara:strand:+ start:362 stop:1375 length:1014 start_codon:yes stop_codon:yes gene_type:complete